MMSKDFYIYGAKSIALGAAIAYEYLNPEMKIRGFLVTDKAGNPAILAGLPVFSLQELSRKLTNDKRNDCMILIATPEDTHRSIEKYLRENGFWNIKKLTSEKEAELMGEYFHNAKLLVRTKDLDRGVSSSTAEILQAKFYKDKKISGAYKSSIAIHPIQVGAELTEERVCELCDNSGESISEKNTNYCELTALYWLWKNRLNRSEADYFGLCHYRRVLDITESEIRALGGNGIDVVLPLPMIHEPSIIEHHSRYVSEDDWNAMKQAVHELHPEYMENFQKIFEQPYMYNYNMFIGSKKFTKEYCEWLFPILFRTEELTSGASRQDRYIGYLGENLMTLYINYNKENLKVAHAGRRMFI